MVTVTNPLGADHGDYLNNDSAIDARSKKIEVFVKNITSEAAMGENAVQELLLRSGATFNKKNNTYIIDPEKLKI